MTKDMATAWWMRYDDEILERDEMLGPIAGKLETTLGLPEEVRRQALITALRGYFDDALEYGYNLK